MKQADEISLTVPSAFDGLMFFLVVVAGTLSSNLSRQLVNDFSWFFKCQETCIGSETVILNFVDYRKTSVPASFPRTIISTGKPRAFSSVVPAGCVVDWSHLWNRFGIRSKIVQGRRAADLVGTGADGWAKTPFETNFWGTVHIGRAGWPMTKAGQFAPTLTVLGWRLC